MRLPSARAVADMLWAAGRPEPDAAAVAAAAASLDPDDDGPHLAAMAAAHRMSGLLWRALEGTGSTAVLGPAAPEVAALTLALRAQASLVVPRALTLAVAPLQAEGLQPVVLKGPALAVRYPEAGLRPMDDIDLLLPRSQHARALRSLEREGWCVQRGSARDRYDTVLVHPAVPSLPLELHYGLQAFYERATLVDADQLWRRRRPLTIGGTSAHVPRVEDELLMLAAHAGKPFHTYVRLIWAIDLAVVIGRQESRIGIDWDLIGHQARRWRCRTALFAGLVLAGRLGAEVPPATIEDLRPRGPRWQARILDTITDMRWPVTVSEGSTFHLRFALADTIWRRFALLAGAAYQMDWGERMLWPVVAGHRALRRSRALAGADGEAHTSVM